MPTGDTEKLWLYGVARHVVANKRRSSRRSANLSSKLASLAEIALDNVEQDATIPDPDLLERLRAGIRTLNRVDLEIIRLTAWEELTPTEISVALNMPPSTVRTRLQRIRSRLAIAVEGPTVSRIHERPDMTIEMAPNPLATGEAI